MLQVRTFELSMMRLDIRQESSRHTEVMDTITKYLNMGSYAAWDEVRECVRGRMGGLPVRSRCWCLHGHHHQVLIVGFFAV